VANLTTGLHLRGNDVQVAAILDPDASARHEFVDLLVERGVTVHPVRVGARSYYAEFKALAALLRARPASVIHTHGYRADVIAGLVAHFRQCAHVQTLHGFIGADRRGRFYEWMQVQAGIRASATLCVSTPIFDRLTRAGARHPVLLRNAVPPVDGPFSRAKSRADLALPADVFVAGWVGRLSPEKDPLAFVDALSTAGDTVHGILLGDGPLYGEVQQRIAALGIGHRVRLAGLIPMASRYFCAFDTLALTSRTEGTPMVVLEAMQCGVPIIASAVGGVPDVLADGAGVLCQPGDSEGIGRALKRLSENAGERLVLAQAGIERATSAFNYERWIERHERLYASVVSGTAISRGAVLSDG
jgi:glycosyltransferase involved in cell wall biosynthesis